MTLASIKAMFQSGAKWRVTRDGGKPLTVNGNTGQSILGANNGTEERILEQAMTTQWVWRKPDGKRIWTNHPKASEVIEAREGFLKFAYDNGVTVTMERLPERQERPPYATWAGELGPDGYGR